MRFKYNDGGKPVKLRERVGHDCAVRALAISSGISYEGALTLCERQGFKNGVGMYDPDYSVVLERFGYIYEEATPGDTLGDVTGCGIANLDGHVVAVVNSRVNDTFDTFKCPSAGMLLGVWRRSVINAV
jgi:hypothetical protein